MELKFKSKFKVTKSGLLSPEEIKKTYLFGVPLEKDGRSVPDELIQTQLDAAITMLEDYLHIKLSLTPIDETRDFSGDDWRSWNFMKLSYPINCVASLEGFKGTTRQVIYPLSWLSIRKNPGEKVQSRLLYMVPNQNSQTNEQLIFSGIMPNLDYYGHTKQIPNYWRIKYITGFEKIPADIKMFIGKFTAMNTMVIANTYLQPNVGIASESISMDGLSQNVSRNIQQGIFSSTINTYSKELQEELKRLFDVYAAVNMITA